MLSIYILLQNQETDLYTFCNSNYHPPILNGVLLLVYIFTFKNLSSGYLCLPLIDRYYQSILDMLSLHI